MGRRSLAALQRLQCNHNLSRLPPQHVFVAAEAIEGARWQICQAQEADITVFECELSLFLHVYSQVYLRALLAP